MTEQELSKYAGKKTFGENNEILTNGIVVGYDPDDNEQCLVARFENGDVSGMGWGKMYYKINFFTKEEEEIYNSGKGCYLFAKIDNVIMEEELDLTKILEGCEGVELFSEVFGVGEVHKVDYFVCVKSKKGYLHYFNTNGRLIHYPDGNCLLWPSETCRDWSQFKKPIKVKEDDWVVCCDRNEGAAILKYKDVTMKWKYVIPFSKFNPDLSEKELKKLSIV